MKKISLTILIIFCLTSFLDAKSITVNKLPGSVEEFTKLRNEIAVTPEGGAVIFILAMMKYTKDRDMGLKFFTIALTRNNLSKGNAYKGFKPHRSLNYHFSRFNNNPYWPFAYIKGAKPDNGYKVSAPFTFVTSRNRYSGSEESGKVKVFVNCFGTRPRPMKLKKNNRGLWKALEFSSFWLGSIKPTKKIDDDL